MTSRERQARGARRRTRANGIGATGTSADLVRRAHAVARLLAAEHASPRHGNKEDPLDELVYIVLSQMTTHHSYERVFVRLRRACGRWDRLLRIPLPSLRALIRDAGLSRLKAARLRSIARRLRADFGTVSLSELRGMPDEEVEAYLTSLPGVGTKTAKCVMMYSLGRRVLPVDTHVRRLSNRLGLLSPRTPDRDIHVALERVVPPGDRYAFHVNAITHGRLVCRARAPRCGACCVLRLCPWGTRRETRRKGP
jgi:endonuclease III